jgi:hypothetical protein
MVEKLVKRFRHDNDSGTQGDQEQRRKNEENKWEDQFDAGLCRLLLHVLSSLGS